MRISYRRKEIARNRCRDLMAKTVIINLRNDKDAIRSSILNLRPCTSTEEATLCPVIMASMERRTCFANSLQYPLLTSKRDHCHLFNLESPTSWHVIEVVIKETMSVFLHFSIYCL